MAQSLIQHRCLNAIGLRPRMASRHTTGPHLRPHLLCRWICHNRGLLGLAGLARQGNSIGSAIANRTVVSRAHDFVMVLGFTSCFQRCSNGSSINSHIDGRRSFDHRHVVHLVGIEDQPGRQPPGSRDGKKPRRPRHLRDHCRERRRPGLSPLSFGAQSLAASRALTRSSTTFRQFLEERRRCRALDSVEHLYRTPVVERIFDGSELEVFLHLLEMGEHLRLRPSEQVTSGF